jgi:hypothetical protein
MVTSNDENSPSTGDSAKVGGEPVAPPNHPAKAHTLPSNAAPASPLASPEINAVRLLTDPDPGDKT